MGYTHRANAAHAECPALCCAVRVLMLGIFTAHRDWVPAVARPEGHMQAVQVRLVAHGGGAGPLAGHGWCCWAVDGAAALVGHRVAAGPWVVLVGHVLLMLC